MKMKIFFLLTFSLILSSNVSAQSLDFLNFRSISVNDIKYHSTRSDVFIRFGKPDSISSPQNRLDPDSIVSILHYPDVSFYLINDRAFFRTIYFNDTNKIAVKAVDFQLDYYTTSDFLKERFPKSYASMIKNHSNYLKLMPCYCDDEIRLRIDEDHIVQIDYIVPWLE